jgi:SAM-dependent methyltransferase
VLDVGCGGGGAIRRLSRLLPDAELHGVDHSPEAVRSALRLNRDLVAAGRASFREGSVSHLPYDDGRFDLVYAIESHYFWPDLPADVAEIRRVLEPGGTLVLAGNVYSGGRFEARNRRFAEAGGMHCLSLAELVSVLEAAGYVDTVARESERVGWFAVSGTDPDGSPGADPSAITPAS